MSEIGKRPVGRAERARELGERRRQRRPARRVGRRRLERSSPRAIGGAAQPNVGRAELGRRDRDAGANRFFEPESPRAPASPLLASSIVGVVAVRRRIAVSFVGGACGPTRAVIVSSISVVVVVVARLELV